MSETLMATSKCVSVEDLLKTSADSNPAVNNGVVNDCEEANTRTKSSESSSLRLTLYIKSKSNWRRIIEAVILTGVILLVWGLFAIPTVFYALPPLQVRYWICIPHVKLHVSSFSCVLCYQTVYGYIHRCHGNICKSHS